MGTVWREHDAVSADSPFENTEIIKVQYLPGVEKSSRIEGNIWLRALIFFAGSVIFLVVSFVTLWREATTPIARDPGRRGR